MSKIYDIISFNNYLYAVDYLGKEAKLGQTVSLKEGKVFNGFEHFANIVASTDASLGLPLLPAIEGNHKLDEGMRKRPGMLGITQDEMKIFEAGYETGHRIASKKKYTEEDIIKAIRQGEMNESCTEIGCTACRKTDEEFIRLLNPIPKQVELWTNHALFSGPPFNLGEELLIVDNFVQVVKYIYE